MADEEKPKQAPFFRQEPLFPEIGKLQNECPHIALLPNKDSIMCRHCGALWVK